MKALALPLTTPAVPANAGDFESPLPPEAGTQNFSDLMGQAIAQGTVDENPEAPANGIETETSGDSETKGSPTETASLAGFELLAAMMLPVAAPQQPMISTEGDSSAGDSSAGNSSGVITLVGSPTTASATSAADTNTIKVNPAPPKSQSDVTSTPSLPAEVSAKVPPTEIPAELKKNISLLSADVPQNIAKVPEGKVPTPDKVPPSPELIPKEISKAPDNTTQSGKANLPEAVAATSIPTDIAKGAEQKLPNAGAPAADFKETSIKLEISGQSDPRPGSQEGNPDRGTSGAKYLLPMQKAEKMNDSAGTVEQNLPITVTAEALPSKAVRLAGSTLDAEKSPGVEKPDASATLGSSTPDIIPAKEVSSRIDPASFANPFRTLERTQDLIAVHAFRLRDSGQDSMQVVLKPSPDLHIALNLQMRDGAMEVTAQLQRGDYEFLNRHWNDLQQQMEARGVKLAPLSNQNPSLNSNSSFSQQSGRQSSEEKATKTSAFAEFAFANVLAPKRTNKTTGARGWESWA